MSKKSNRRATARLAPPSASTPNSIPLFEQSDLDQVSGDIEVFDLGCNKCMGDPEVGFKLVVSVKEKVVIAFCRTCRRPTMCMPLLTASEADSRRGERIRAIPTKPEGVH